mmetsp:Transcript_157905/g.278753  ORF Transcript_157905/g.278753 Transcript_157905/m.278753 type:complete len:214 (+) Transcript_157905:458-1099(+)
MPVDVEEENRKSLQSSSCRKHTKRHVCHVEHCVHQLASFLDLLAHKLLHLLDGEGPSIWLKRGANPIVFGVALYAFDCCDHIEQASCYLELVNPQAMHNLCIPIISNEWRSPHQSVDHAPHTEQICARLMVFMISCQLPFRALLVLFCLFFISLPLRSLLGFKLVNLTLDLLLFCNICLHHLLLIVSLLSSVRIFVLRVLLLRVLLHLVWVSS